MAAASAPVTASTPIGASLRRSFLIGLTSRDVECRDTTRPGLPVVWSAKPEPARPSRVPYERVVRQSRVLLRVAVAGEAFAAAHLEAAPRALEGAVAPLHRRCAARAGLDRGLGCRRGGRQIGRAACRERE